MKLRSLVPPNILRELEEVAHECKQSDPTFDVVRDPFCTVAVLAVWCVREIVRMRKERAG